MPGWTPQDIWGTMRRARLMRVLVVYLGVSFAVLEGIDLLTDAAGLPDWVVPGAIVLLLIGLPILIATALVQSAPSLPLEAGPASAREHPGETSVAEVASVAKGWLTWRKAILGGVLAFAFLGLTVAGYMAMRVLGIGPVGSLVAAGVLEAREPIILADFEDHTGDPELAVVVTEALRIDIAQSPLVALLPSDVLAEALNRMEVERGTPIDRELGRELAKREGIKAVIAGEIGAAGTSFALSLELITAESGEILAAFRETAADSSAIMTAVDRLSKRMRERIGESLRTIRANEPLDRVTTSSLKALLNYSEAIRAIDYEGDVGKGVALLEEAIARDTTFAMAYRTLGLAVYFDQRERGVEALTKAFEYRDRLTERERYLTTAYYYDYVAWDFEKAITAYNTLLDSYPDDNRALLDLAGIYSFMRDYGRAAELLKRGTEADTLSAVCYPCLINNLFALGRFDEAETTAERFARNVPGNPQVYTVRSDLASARGDYEAAEEQILELKEKQSGSLGWRVRTSEALAELSILRGKLAEAERHLLDALSVNEQRGPASYWRTVADLGVLDAWFRGAPERGLRQVEAALERYPFDSIPPIERPYLPLARFYAVAGRPARAGAMLEEWEAEVALQFRQYEESERLEIWGIVKQAEGRPAEAIADLRSADRSTPCAICLLPELARAYEQAGNADSALAIYERYVTTPWIHRVDVDAYYLASAYERLGSLYEERGDAEKAAHYYGRLTELWKDADPELQPRVEAARRAVQALSTDR